MVGSTLIIINIIKRSLIAIFLIILRNNKINYNITKPLIPLKIKKLRPDQGWLQLKNKEIEQQQDKEYYYNSYS